VVDAPREVRRVTGALIVAATALAFGAAALGGSGVVVLATTTSTQDSGLLESLVPMFERVSGYTVKTVAVGTGQALAMGDRGEADVVLVHAPELEQEYLAKGTLTNRRLVMHNDFVITGPAADPAGIRTARNAADALARIALARATFVSRGDSSGTHAKERSLWTAAGIEPQGPWYLESGQGMGSTLTIASEKRAYTLADRGTYLAFKKRVALAILVEGDAPLLNVYHVMEVNPARHPRVNAAGGKAFADYIVSPAAQGAIRTFGVDRYGEPLFFPDAGPAGPGGR
jgi:tungstate transport system substrate-binding protein